MSKRRDVVLAVRALAKAALPYADVRGFDGDTARPSRIGPGGCVIGEPGDAGEPKVDLSPPSYNYRHVLALDVAPPPDGADADAVLDSMLEALGAAIAADRTLGGLCDRLEAEAPLLDDSLVAGSEPVRWAAFNIVASYATSDPLN
jgi:hypothetical protein